MWNVNFFFFFYMYNYHKPQVVMRQKATPNTQFKLYSLLEKQKLKSFLTLVSLIQTGDVCCLSINSRNFLYQDSGLVKVMELENVWPQTFSNFWHCSNSFLLLLWAPLKLESKFFFTFSKTKDLFGLYWKERYVLS